MLRPKSAEEMRRDRLEEEKKEKKRAEEKAVVPNCLIEINTSIKQMNLTTLRMMEEIKNAINPSVSREIEVLKLKLETARRCANCRYFNSMGVDYRDCCFYRNNTKYQQCVRHKYQWEE